MPQPLKYKDLIFGLGLTMPCPDNCRPIERISFRWVKSDFSDGQSFLPNLIYDQNRGKKPRKNDPTDEIKCGSCALSFFGSVEFSSMNVEAIGGAEKLTRLLGYTHLAEGNLINDHGLGSVLDERGHFIFFEFEGVVLDTIFKIVESL